MSAPVDGLAMVKRLAKEAEIALLDGAGIKEGDAVPQDIAEKIVGIWKACDGTSAAIAELIEADKAYDRIRIAPYDRHDPVAARAAREEFIAAQDRRAAALRAVGGQS